MKEGHNGHRKRRRPASGRDRLNVGSIRPADRFVRRCPDCGKHCFITREMARAAARDLWPGDSFNVHRCGTHFHYGHGPARKMPDIGVGQRKCSDTRPHREHKWGDENDTIWICEGEGTHGSTGHGDDAAETEQGGGRAPRGHDR